MKCVFICLGIKYDCYRGRVIPPWLFSVHMGCVAKGVNARLLGRGLSLMRNNGREWNVNQLEKEYYNLGSSIALGTRGSSFLNHFNSFIQEERRGYALFLSPTNLIQHSF